jgi:hypothetical protein
VIPAGEAWRAFLAKYHEPVLHDRDQSHPTLAGSFLAACAAYATLFGRSPAALAAEVNGLSPSDVKRLASVAATVTSRPRTSRAR